MSFDIYDILYKEGSANNAVCKALFSPLYFLLQVSGLYGESVSYDWPDN